MKRHFGLPMTFRNMRENGARAVRATCSDCQHEADVNVDALPAEVAVPEAGKQLKCSACGGKRITTRPAWHTRAPRLPAWHALAHEAAEEAKEQRAISVTGMLSGPPGRGTGGPWGTFVGKRTNAHERES